MAPLSDFYAGDDKRFRVIISLGGAIQDIRADTVIWTLKRSKSDPDSAALLMVNGDVATDGANGVAIFAATRAQTALLVPTVYACEIRWAHAGGTRRRVLLEQNISVLDPVSDP